MPHIPALLFTALNTISEGLLIVDSNLKILYTNTKARDFLGIDGDYFDREKVLQKYHMFDPSRRKQLTAKEGPAERALKGLKYTDYRLKFEDRTDGSIRYISYNGTPLIGDENEIIGAVVSFHDVTEKYLQEQQLKQERAFFKNVLDLIPAAIFVRKIVGDYIFTNQCFEDFKKQFKKMGGWNMNTDPVLARIQEHDQEVIETLTAKEFDEVLTMADGSVKEFRTIRFPITQNQTGEVLICGIAFDMTETNLLKKSLENERLRSINTMKLATVGTLAGEIGHEIHNPITIIKSITFLLRDLLQEGPIDETLLKDKINQIDSTLDRVSKIIFALKNLSRRTDPASQEKTCLQRIFDDVLALSDLRLKKNGVALNFRIGEALMNREIQCNEVQISEVFMNLFSNAVDAVERLKSPWIDVSAHEDENFLYVTVKDSGAGVPEENREKIFEAFFTTKSAGKGTGLGLSISRNIMRSHHGDLLLGLKDEPSSFIVKIKK